MSITLADQYYLKANDYYPYNMESTIENLGYALSYQDDHAAANCLMGQIYMYHMKDYGQAGFYFYRALEGNINFPDTYKHYGLLRIWEAEYCRAKKIINRGLKVKGMDQSSLFALIAMIHEYKGEYPEAKLVLKKVKLFITDEEKLVQVKRDLNRVKKKMKAFKPMMKTGN